jgi:hypothetical protein
VTGVLLMEGDTTAAPTGWWFGTNRPGGAYYAGRVHVVYPGQGATALCGLPVDDVWVERPSVPEYLCPDCCVAAIAASYPVFSPAPEPLPDDWFAPSPRQGGRFGTDEQLAEQTRVLPPIRDDDP